MKQYILIIKSNNKNIKDRICSNIFTEDDKDAAINILKKLNLYSLNVKYELMEIIPLIDIKPECNMNDEELKEYTNIINNMNNDLQEIISFDEWASREYGETQVDYYYTALKLYDAGYRKITKLKGKELQK